METHGKKMLLIADYARAFTKGAGLVLVKLFDLLVDIDEEISPSLRDL
jgi:hypothetical protein